MSTKRSYLDNLNAGRQRRSASPLEEINRTLDQLETRLERALEARERDAEPEEEVTRRIQRLSQETAARLFPRQERPAYTSAGNHQQATHASLERVAREVENTRRQEDQLASIGNIAHELSTLREDMRGMMSSGLHREFDSLRREIARIMEAVPFSPMAAELNAEFARLSHSIEQLAERSDDKSVKLLRLELEQVKNTLAKLAREESVRALDQRWETLENRLSAGGEDRPEPAIQAMNARLEEIGAAINRLPESLSLRSLDERVRKLASALEQFVEQHDRNQPNLYTTIEERLDEISRAITASAAMAHSPSFDVTMLERIEARIASLANQIDELAEDRPNGMIVERLNALLERVDEVARRIDLPEQAVEQLAQQIAEISRKLDAAPASPETEHLFHSIEERFTQLSDMIERRQEDAIQQGQGLFQDLERRLTDMAERFDRAGSGEEERGIMAALDDRFAELAARIEDARPGTDGEAMRTLEARLEDISGRLQNSAAAGASGIDPEVIRNLEAQVASLSAHLARPGRELPELDNLAPRLEGIERSIHENRAAVVEAAREAAEEAIRAMSAARAGPMDDRLKEELENLEALTRKSDERNTRTFEAIHDTLLKIVERLGSLEMAGDAKMALGSAPSLDPSESYDDEAEAFSPLQPRTPAEAAAAAAEAALRDDERVMGPADEADRRGGMLGGFSRALTGRRASDRSTPAGEGGEAPEPALDMERINEPLEPGSGAPDLNAIMRRVRDERGEDLSADTAKADFIAAARRAAQAAAAETEILKRGSAEKEEKRGKGGLGRVLRRHKGKMLLTLGAAILIAGGFYYAETVLPGEDTVRVAETEPPAPAGEPIVAEAPVRSVDEVDAPESTRTAAIAAPEADAPEAEALPQEAEVALPSNLPPAASATAVAERTPDAATSATPSAEPVRTAMAVGLPDIPEEIGPAPLREAAQTGDAAALYEIAERYAQGRGVEADAAEAARWYEAAAELGLAPAQYRIGSLYEKGNGVERDLSKARMWYERAAENGNAGAMHNLGVLYAMGVDGEPDNHTAAEWFQEAAELGVTDSQFNLGILAAKGAGVKRDLTEAYKWFDLVARKGDEDAAEKRDEIAKLMAPADLVKAQGKAKLWEAREVDPEANTVDIPAEWRDGMPDEATVTGSVDVKKAVTNIQLILNKIGYDAGPADGVMGEKTRSAIKAFQEENGLAVTGQIDDRLVRALLAKNDAAE